ncbi:hypothetical protein DICSQDRAFT_173444 [Dichomitus squalens LYAD-421 SS1]|uniref:Uncharacterized protein n=2 Tax=Dichomitus squalens TaxID=114155 RepID=A0A4Q9MAH6_9APHY|nr:uncharacterized protein DICSQDRAFT_173444 [Dichomitus squalens LYAD-421 SS1]EJF57949.1 hypothetical protein DICSQDRAFT_173444 [Dichomitus squalens LYAD-421 SS1]TBU23218.1 hypothetical protein BD311DRAFT_819711 [Dichomitus squalens]
MTSLEWDGIGSFIPREKFISNVYTDAWLYDKKTLHDLEAVVAMLRRNPLQALNSQALETEDSRGLLDYDDIEIGIHLQITQGQEGEKTETDGGKTSSTRRWWPIRRHSDGRETVVKGCYHICNIKKRQVFWLDEVDTNIFWEDLDHRIIGIDHLGGILVCGSTLHANAADSNWIPTPMHREHLYIFPDKRIISQLELDDLNERLAFWAFDAASSKASTSPCTADELAQFTKMVGKIKDQKMLVFGLGKLMSALLKIRFAYFHGEEHAQLNNSHGFYPHHYESDSHSPWFTILNWLSFYTAVSYYLNLNQLWIGRKMSTSRWNDFVIQLQDDWLAAITPATVVLAANFSSLALSSVDQNGPPFTERNLGQIVSYISLILNISNIAAATILARQHRSGHNSSFEGEPPKGGPQKKQVEELERLAVIYSIPATFFWLLTLFVSIAWICFHRTNQLTRYTVVGIVGLSMVLLALVLLYTYRDSHGWSWFEIWAFPLQPLVAIYRVLSKWFSKMFPERQKYPRKDSYEA